MINAKKILPGNHSSANIFMISWGSLSVSIWDRLQHRVPATPMSKGDGVPQHRMPGGVFLQASPWRAMFQWEPFFGWITHDVL